MSDVVELRDVTDSDLPILFEHQADPISNEVAAFPARDWASFKAHWAKNLANESNITKTILYSGQVVGMIMCFILEGKREVGYWIGRKYWGKGIATEALAQLIQSVETRPLYGYVAKHNIGSRRVLEKCGFTFLGEEGNENIFMLK